MIFQVFHAIWGCNTTVLIGKAKICSRKIMLREYLLVHYQSVTKILQILSSVPFTLLSITVFQYFILPDFYYYRIWAISEKYSIHSTWNNTASSTKCTISCPLPAIILRNTITWKPKSLQMGTCLGRVEVCEGKLIQSIQTLRHIQYYSEISCFFETRCLVRVDLINVSWGSISHIAVEFPEEITG